MAFVVLRPLFRFSVLCFDLHIKSQLPFAFFISLKIVESSVLLLAIFIKNRSKLKELQPERSTEQMWVFCRDRGRAGLEAGLVFDLDQGDDFGSGTISTTWYLPNNAWLASHEVGQGVKKLLNGLRAQLQRDENFHALHNPDNSQGARAAGVQISSSSSQNESAVRVRSAAALSWSPTVLQEKAFNYARDLATGKKAFEHLSPAEREAYWGSGTSAGSGSAAAGGQGTQQQLSEYSELFCDQIVLRPLSGVPAAAQHPQSQNPNPPPPVQESDRQTLLQHTSPSDLAYRCLSQWLKSDAHRPAVLSLQQSFQELAVGVYAGDRCGLASEAADVFASSRRRNESGEEVYEERHVCVVLFLQSGRKISNKPLASTTTSGQEL